MGGGYGAPRVGAYPGSFNPLTVAHLAIAEAALHQRGLARVDLVVSRVALAKEDVDRPRLADRVEVLERAAANRPGLGVVVTDAQLLADIAAGYDILVMGADKWVQLHDPTFYGSVEARDAALARLPEVAVAPRPPFPVPPGRALALAPELARLSSSGAREGDRSAMAPEAAAFDAGTGAWSDPPRYAAWLAGADYRP